jgi:hypothetical protein
MSESDILVTKFIITKSIKIHVLCFQSHARPFHSTPVPDVRQDIVAGIATRYRSVAPGFAPRWGRDFLDPCRPAPRPTRPPVQ